MYQKETKLFALLFVGLIGVHPSILTAQETDESATPPEAISAKPLSETKDNQATAAHEGQSDATPSGSREDSVAHKKDVEALESKYEDLAKQVEELQEINRERDKSELFESDDMGVENDAIDRINLSAFFDLTLGFSHYPEGNALRNWNPSKLSFSVNNLNIYFTNQLTDKLKALVELHFSFMPHGREVVSIEEIDPDATYRRVNNTMLHPISQKRLSLGGVMIERVQMTWQPFEFFGVTAGRFLTPFGIWNVDHGSPTIIPIVKPSIIIRDFIPLAQTGVFFHGRFFLSMKSTIDYAVTVSNGRGPTESVYDLEHDKAVGLHLKYEYYDKDWQLSIGGYGYVGHTTDISKRLVAKSIQEADFVIDEEYSYKEMIGEIDLLIKFYGVRIQSEYATGIVRYDNRPVRYIYEVGFESPSQYQPDYTSQTFYALLAWDLPLDRLIGEKTLTPFFMIDISRMEDTDYYFYPDYLNLNLGINFKPSTAATLKASATRVESMGSDSAKPASWLFLTQLAIVF